MFKNNLCINFVFDSLETFFLNISVHHQQLLLEYWSFKVSGSLADGQKKYSGPTGIRN